MTRPRHFRIIRERTGDKPWIVQYSIDAYNWADAYRFHQADQAVVYAQEVEARDRALLEAER